MLGVNGLHNDVSLIFTFSLTRILPGGGAVRAVMVVSSAVLCSTCVIGGLFKSLDHFDEALRSSPDVLEVSVSEGALFLGLVESISFDDMRNRSSQKNKQSYHFVSPSFFVGFEI